MTHLNQRISALRDILHDSHLTKANRWTKLCVLFLTWPKELPHREAVDYAAQAILQSHEPWGPHIAWAPAAWQGGRYHSPAHPFATILEATTITTPPALWIPPGSCTLGEPTAPQAWCHDEMLHHVHVTQGFLIQTTPIQQERWEELMHYNPSATQHPKHPVAGVNWTEATLFANTLSRTQGLTEFYTFRNMRGHPSASTFSARVRFPKHCTGPRTPSGWYLPTETQWEYAARALGSAMTYATPYSSSWFADNSDHQTQPVAQKLPNLWGLHDMLGNVWEWCSDAYVPYSEHPVKDPFIAHNTSLQRETRALRGGSYLTGHSNLRLSNRWHLPPGWRRPDIGVRLVRNFDPFATSTRDD